MKTKQPADLATAPTVIRIFVSSTFRDMQEERDLLGKQTFPELRRRCRERGLEVIDVDLRWGVTEEQAENGEVLPICLSEIDNCRPYFIGLLGELYGWVPDEIKADFYETWPWLKRHPSRSITELEILHGALLNVSLADSAHFYFRSPDYIRTLPAHLRQSYICEDDDSAEKLTELKERIRQSGFPLKENYSDPGTLAEMVLNDLLEEIDASYPMNERVDPLQKSASDHRLFAINQSGVYVPREGDFDRLNRHIEETGPPLIVHGKAGSGKTALLSSWATEHAKDNPNDVIFEHYIGCTPESHNPEDFLRRLFGELCLSYKVNDGLPETKEDLRSSLPLWLQNANKARPLILIIDGLDAFIPWDDGPPFSWLPDNFPSNIRVIVSIRPGSLYTGIQFKGWASHELKKLDSEQREKMLESYLWQYRKKLDVKNTKHVLSSPQTSNPLYLRLLLEELRILGMHENIKEQIDYYLQALTVEDLFSKILERMENDFEGNCPDLVSRAASLILSAHKGLSEYELLELLGGGDAMLPRRIWSPFFISLQTVLINRSGLFIFSHEYIALAVKKRYLPSSASRLNTHRKLAEYFNQKSQPDRRIVELPWHLAKSEQWERLRDFLLEPETFLALSNHTNMTDLTRYWAQIGSKFDMAAAMEKSWSKFENQDHHEISKADYLLRVAYLLKANAHYEVSLKFFDQALAIGRDDIGWDHPKTAIILIEYAHSLLFLGKREQAKTAMIQALAILTNQLGQEHPKTVFALSYLAELHADNDELAMAESIYRRALSLAERWPDEHPDLPLIMDSFAVILMRRREYGKAEEIQRKALALFERRFGIENIETAKSIDNLAATLLSLEKYDEAAALLNRGLTIWEKVLGPDHPHTLVNLNHHSLLLKKKKDYAGQERILQRIVASCERFYGQDHQKTLSARRKLNECINECRKVNEPYVSDSNARPDKEFAVEGETLSAENPQTGADAGGADQNKVEEVQFLKNALQEYTDSTNYNWKMANFCLYRLATLHFKAQEYDEAEQYARQAVDMLVEQLGPDSPDITGTICLLALILQQKSSYDEAESLFRRSLELSEKYLGQDHKDTLSAARLLALLLKDKKDYKGAEQHFNRILMANERGQGVDNLETAISLCDLASLKVDLNHYDVAMELYHRAFSINENSLGLEDPTIISGLNRLTAAIFSKRDYDKALPLVTWALELNTRALGPEHIETISRMENFGTIHLINGDYEIASEHLSKAAELFEKTLGEVDPRTIACLSNLLITEKRNNNTEKLAALIDKLVNVTNKVNDTDFPELTLVLANLAILLMEQNDFGRAEPFCRRILRLNDAGLVPTRPSSVATLSQLAMMLQNQNHLGLAEKILQMQLRLCENEFGCEHMNTLASLNTLGQVLLRQQELERAEPILMRGLELSERLYGQNHKETAIFLGCLAAHSEMRKDCDKAEILYRRALQVARNVLMPDDTELAISIRNLAFVLKTKNANVEAESLYREALEIYQRASVLLTPEAISTLDHLAELNVELGNKEEAERLFRKTISLKEKIIVNQDLKIENSLIGLASLLNIKGDYFEAENLYRRLVTLCEKKYGMEKAVTISNMSLLADTLQSAGKVDEAEEIFQKIIAINEESIGKNCPENIEPINRLALLLKRKQNLEESELLFRRSIKIAQTAHGLEHPDTLDAYDNLAEILFQKGDHEEAESIYKKVLPVNRMVFGTNHIKVMKTLTSLGILLNNKGDFQNSEPLLQEALAINENILGTDHDITVKSMQLLVNVLYKQQNYDYAEELYRKMLAICEKKYGLTHTCTADALDSLSKIYHAKEDYLNAATFCERVLEIREKLLGPDHPTTGQTLINFAIVLRNLNKNEQSANILERYLDIFGNIETPDRSTVVGLSICHNELAFHKYVPEEKWAEAEYHYQQSMDYATKTNDSIGVANATLNLQTMYQLSGQKVDIEKVKESTQILDDAGDPRAKKGYKVLKNYS